MLHCSNVQLKLLIAEIERSLDCTGIGRFIMDFKFTRAKTAGSTMRLQPQMCCDIN